MIDWEDRLLSQLNFHSSVLQDATTLMEVIHSLITDSLQVKKVIENRQISLVTAVRNHKGPAENNFVSILGHYQLGRRLRGFTLTYYDIFY